MSKKPTNKDSKFIKAYPSIFKNIKKERKVFKMKEPIAFAKWIAEEFYYPAGEKWFQFKGKEITYISTEQLYELFIKSELYRLYIDKLNTLIE